MEILEVRDVASGYGEVQILWGTDLTLDTHALLESNRKLNFQGNIEGRDILMGKADVVVSDGFVGNIILKFAESTSSFFGTMLKKKIRGNLFANIGALLMAAAFRSFKQSLDSAEYGGAPLLGVDGICIIGHGSSSPTAIKNAVKAAASFVRTDVNEHIKQDLRKLDGGNVRKQ